MEDHTMMHHTLGTGEFGFVSGIEWLTLNR